MERNTPIEKMRMESADLISQNVEKIAELFPECVTEAADQDGKIRRLVDFEKLRQVLSGDIVDDPERYEFTWVGKNAAQAEAQTTIRKTLRPCPEESRDWDTTQNLYIEGDNIDVLKLLQESYLGRIKMIYIDPPYNTGSDSFVYPDNYRANDDEYETQGKFWDEEGNKTFKENNDTNPRFHSDWCSMIYSRLLLARNLLTNDGVIFISIDDNEQENLKKICDTVFGSRNFIAQIVWQKVHTRKNSAINFSSSHEYVLCYAKKKRSSSTDTEGFKRNLLPRDNTDAYSNPDNDPKGPWKLDPITAHNYYAADYTITKPNGVVITRPQDSYWRYSEETINRMIKENAIIWGEGSSMPMGKRYLCDVQDGLVPTTLFTREFAGDSSQAKKQLDSLFPDCKGIFDYSKSVKLISRLIQIGLGKDDIVLDFFSGSATTAHAILELNSEDGGNRHFIMVQLPEECNEESEAAKIGCFNICEIGKERIRRAGDKIKADNPLTSQNLDVGFRVLKVDSTNMNDVYYNASEVSQDLIKSTESNIKDDRTDLDLLFGCLLDWGVPLSYSYKSEAIDGATVHDYNDGDLIACFEENISEKVVKEIARRKPTRAVFRDSCFASDAAKINVTELFKRYSPDTRIKTI